MICLSEKSGDMQQSLRRDASDVQADSSRPLVQVDQDGLQPEVSGVEGRRVTTGPGPYHDNIGIVNSLGGRHFCFSSSPWDFRHGLLQTSSSRGGLVISPSSSSRGEATTMKVWILARKPGALSGGEQPGGKGDLPCVCCPSMVSRRFG